MKALVKNGAIQLQEPLPADWSEGTALEVGKALSQPADDALDQWYAELESACSQMDPEDDRILKEALLEVRRQAKEQARKEAGLEG